MSKVKTTTYHMVAIKPEQGSSVSSYFHKDRFLTKIIEDIPYATKEEIIKLYASNYISTLINQLNSKRQYEWKLRSIELKEEAKKNYIKIAELNKTILLENQTRKRKKRLWDLPRIPRAYSNEEIKEAYNTYRSNIKYVNETCYNFNYFKIKSNTTTIEEW